MGDKYCGLRDYIYLIVEQCKINYEKETKMKPLNEYEIKRPTEKDFTTKWYYRKGEVIAKKIGNNHPSTVNDGWIDTDELIDCVTDKSVDQIAYKEANKDYLEKASILREQFYSDLLSEYNLSNTDVKARKLIAKIEDKHGSSFQTIIDKFDEYMDILNDN